MDKELDQTKPNIALYVTISVILGTLLIHLILWLVKRKQKNILYNPLATWSWIGHLWFTVILLIFMMIGWSEFSDLKREFLQIERELNTYPSKSLVSIETELDVALLSSVDENLINNPWLSPVELRNLESRTILFNTILMMDWGKAGLFHQVLLDSGYQLVIYYPLIQFVNDVIHSSILFVGLVTLLLAGFGWVYSRQMARVAGSLSALTEAASLNVEINSAQEKQLHSSNITYPAVEQLLASRKRSDAYLASYRALLALEKSQVTTISKQIAGKWLFSPLQPLHPTSLRFIFPPVGGTAQKQHEAISSLGTNDPYEEFDPLILSISQRTDRLILQDTSQLLKNGTKTKAALPKSIFVINLIAEGKKFGILWGGYADAHEFDPEELELLDFSCQNLMAALDVNKQVEQESKTAERYRAIMNWTPIPIFTVEPPGRIDFANQSAIFLFAIEALPSDVRQIPLISGNTTLRQLISNPDRVEMSAELQLQDDQIFQCAISSLVVDGKQSGRVFSFQNITEIRKLEKQQSDFVNTVSHDLRQPLTSIRGYATMIEIAGGLNSNQVDFLGKISDGVDSMSQMVESLLALGQVEAGIGLQIEIISMRDLIEKINRTYQFLAAQKQITFKVIFEATDIMVRADWSLLEQALRNVIENAIKYSNPGGEVILSVDEIEGELEIKVSDDGIGISPDDQKHVFERFYRGKNEIARRRKGTGLGLSIVKSIIDKHGGQIDVESRPGKGTIFSINIPLRQE